MRLFIATAFAAAFLMAFPIHAQAMPNFAQAYHVQCNVCHTQVPALNAYGRYVQRTGYSVLDPHVLKKEYPAWIDFPITYTEQTPNAAQWVAGNVALHLDGLIDDNWSYHVQQWFVQDNQPGGLDTAWVAYNNLLNHDGHLFVGKLELPAPSEFSQWMDVTGLSINAGAEMTVGEHTYELDANRWGTKFVYDRGSLDVEAAYVTSSADLSGFNDYSDDTDKTFQYKLAFANPKNPLEVGYYGASGSYPLPEGGTDHYNVNAFYVQRDPTNHIPGLLATYQMANDNNPGLGAPPAGSNAGSVELFEPIGPRGMVAIGKQFTNDGMGDQVQVGNIDVSYHVMRFVMLYAEEAFNQQQKPTWNGLIWFALPVGPI